MPQVHPLRFHAIHSRVRSFSRAGGRLTDAQARALERHGRRYVVEVYDTLVEGGKGSAADGGHQSTFYR